MESVTETPEPNGPAPPVAIRPNRLQQAALWVVIAAGVVFIAAVLFWSGVFFSHHGGGSGHDHLHHGPCMTHPWPPGPHWGHGPAGNG